MTLLVGVLCENGAVIAADRQVTHGALGNLTVGYPGNKVHDFGGDLIYAVSGPVSLGQQLGNLFETKYPSIKGSHYFKIVPGLQTESAAILGPALQTASQASKALGNPAILEGLCGSLIAAPFGDGLKLVEVNYQGRFEHMTKDTAFICVGGGKANADPFIRFLWSVFWKDRPPLVEEGVLMVYWTIKAAIEAATSGVGFDVDVAYLKNIDGKKYELKRLGQPDDFLEHNELIAEGCSALRAIREKMRPQSDTTTEPQETPPAALT